jgi:nucleotide-binding universal stress UspA family protein
MLPFRKILYAVDFSEPCRGVVPYVSEAAERFSSELILLHAFDLVPAVYGEFGAFAATGFPAYSELRKSETTRLEDFAREMFPGRKPQLMVKDGEPGHVIAEVVRHHGADLVMMPTQGLGRLRRFLLGSVTSKVLHDVSCAVWTGVHHPQAEHKPRLPYESILCALSLDDEAPAILRAAAAFSKAYGATLSLVHVVETPPAAWEVDYAPYRKAVMDSADMQLRTLKRDAGVEAAVSVVEGPTADGVRKAAVQRNADLVIVGRGHSQQAVGRILSHLYGIVREAPCPVLSI